MQNPQRELDPFAGVTKIVAYVAGAFVAFFGWPGLYYGSIDSVRIYALENYPVFPAWFVTFFWGLMVLLALFGLTSLLTTLIVKLILKALGRL